MSLSLRHWLTEHNLDIPHISQFSSGQIAGLAFRIVQDMELKSLSIFDICPLVEVLEMPLGAVVLEISVFAQLTQNLVTAFSQKKSLKRNEGTWLAFQIAYLRALHQVLSQEKKLHRPWIDRMTISDRLISRPLPDAQLQALLKTLRPGKLTDTQAEQALSVVADSLLVQQMNNASVAWLLANSAEEAEAKASVQRLVNGLAGHLLAAIAENAPAFAQLQKFFRLGNSLLPNYTSNASAAGDKIDLYRELYRASLIQSYSEPIFIESFALKDIYVFSKGLPTEKGSQEMAKTSQSVDLMTWAQQQLSDLETVALIESEAGYGKSSFCQIWAGIVAQEVYPNWMPILINLAEVTPGDTLEETLNSGFRGNFHIHLAEWLELSHPRCLLLLDGLDELPPSSMGKRAKAIFIQQLLDFQSKRQHKVFLTSRLSILPEIARELRSQFNQIIIERWEQDELRQWFQQWAKVQSLPIAQNFFTFLKQAGIFSKKPEFQQLSALVRQPLMLYLLGILHRDELLDDEMLQLAAKAQYRGDASLLWEIYYRLSKWLLGYPQAEGIKTVQMNWGLSHIHRTQEAIANLLQGYHPEELLEIMQDTALQILHSGRSQISWIDELGILPTFYFKLTEKPRNFSNRQSPIAYSLSFAHSKLGDYFCAKAIILGLKRLVERTTNAYGEQTFVLDSRSEIALHLYKLLGYGVLSSEIEALVVEGLRRSNKREFSFEVLCQRLLPFWYTYCQGHWLDEGIGHQALTYFQVLQNPVGIEQVNAAVGLNVFLLLFSSHQEAKKEFLPCGHPASLTEFNSEALMWLIGRTSILGKNTLISRIRSKSFSFINLSGVHLEDVMLAGADFRQVNLSHAELVGANLAAANFQDANLAGANLSKANLNHANLMGADLRGANLTGVNLESVNLTNACLFQAMLTDADRQMALSKGAIFSSEQFQIIKSLLSQQYLLNGSNTTGDTVAWTHSNLLEKGIIESVEGELVLPEDPYEDYGDDATVTSDQ
ncbi:pentapeptide repeat-containing protein [Scytonema sp. NUACC26]|uniref:pentapeptide repeat-containing protein n=1 Tax=Scytonema sp. NUACC26 TaxID=3140176 RepID=UPI0034DBBC71